MFNMRAKANEKVLKFDNKNHVLDMFETRNAHPWEENAASNQDYRTFHATLCRVGPIYSSRNLFFLSAFCLGLATLAFSLSFFSQSKNFHRKSNTMHSHELCDTHSPNVNVCAHFVSINSNLHGINRNEHFDECDFCLIVVMAVAAPPICNSTIHTHKE